MTSSKPFIYPSESPVFIGGQRVKGTLPPFITLQKRKSVRTSGVFSFLSMYILRKLSYIKCCIYSSSSLGFPSFSHSFDSIRLRDMEMSGKLHCMKQLMAEGEKCSLVSRQIRYSFLLSFNLIFAKDGIIPSRVSSKLSQVSSVIFSCG